jgi:NitT/TauT family transport system substrate-binding protein
MHAVANGYRHLAVLLVLAIVLTACGSAGARGPAARAPADGSGAQAAPNGAAASGQPSTSGPAVATAPPAHLSAAFVSIAGSMLPAWLAEDRGIYDKYGLDVELTYVAGQAKIAEALLSGDLDFGITPAPSAMGPGLQGADLVMIASWANKSAFSLYARPEIKTVEDLRGKRIATSRRGSLSEQWAVEVLSRYGMEPERDYVILPMGGQPEQLAGLQNGAVDAAALGVPTNVLARKLGLNEILKHKENALEFASVGLVTSRRLLAEQPAVAERFVKATAEGVAMMMQDTEAALAVLGERTRIDDRELLEESLDFDRYRTSRDMIPSQEGLQAAMDSLNVNNPAAAEANPMDYVDLTIVRKLKESGFIESLYR